MQTSYLHELSLANEPIALPDGWEWYSPAETGRKVFEVHSAESGGALAPKCFAVMARCRNRHFVFNFLSIDDLRNQVGAFEPFKEYEKWLTTQT